METVRLKLDKESARASCANAVRDSHVKDAKRKNGEPAIDFVRAAHEFAHTQEVCAARWISPLGISVAQCNVLLRLSEVPDVKSSELAKSIGLGKASVGRVIRQLVALRMVEAHADPSDRRAASLRLTDLGRSICADLVQIRRAVHEEILAGISADELALFGEVLRRLTHNTRRIRPSKLQKKLSGSDTA